MFAMPLLRGGSGRRASRHARKVSRTRPRARRLCHEPLEDRRLLSFSYSDFSDPDDNHVSVHTRGTEPSRPRSASKTLHKWRVRLATAI